jgi:FkbH-like protein
MKKDNMSIFPRKLELWLSGDKLRFRAEEEVLSESKIDFIRSNKDRFITFLKDTGTNLIWVLPLAQNQKALWFLYEVDQGNIAYNISLAGTMKVLPENKKIKEILTGLVSKYPPLRTVFATLPDSGHVPCQIVMEGGKVLPAITEISDIRENDILACLRDIYSQPFNLETGPLFRTTIIRNDDSSVLSFVFHHIICDAISLKNFFNEFLDSCHISGIWKPDLRGNVSVNGFEEFIFDQLDFLQSPEGEDKLKRLTDTIRGRDLVIDLPSDYKRPDIHRFRGKTLHFAIDQAVCGKLREYSKNMNATVNVVLLSIFEYLVSKIRLKADFIIGMPVAGRTREEYQDAFGYFINLVPLVVNLEPGKVFSDFLKENKKYFYDILEFQDIPFPSVVENLAPERDLSRTPVFQVVFNYLNSKSLGCLINFLGDGTNKNDSNDILQIKPLKVPDQEGQFDLTLEVVDDDRVLLCALKYNTDLFSAETAERFRKEFDSITEQVLTDPEFGSDWLQNPEGNRENLPVIQFNITGTFTVEPVSKYLEFWSSKLGFKPVLSFPGYNQVFGQLLDPVSIFNRAGDAFNILLVRFEDLIKRGNSTGTESELTGKVSEFEKALYHSLSCNGKSKYILAICPASPSFNETGNYLDTAEMLEERLFNLQESFSNLVVISSREIADTYDIEYYEGLGEEIGHIPYTVPFFVSVATIIFRKIHALSTQPFKAIAVDCDNTLWKGVAAEDGPLGVMIGEAERSLQRFLLRQYEAGVLICLCSKNRKEDVLEVFEKNPGMILKMHNISFHRINWNPKPENIKDLAKEINIGTDSFVFIDDNPVECEEVRNMLPEVLTIQLPRDGFTGKELLNSWVFDRIKITGEDIKRAQKYREEVIRKSFRSTSGSYKDFIEGLNLRIEIEPINEKDIPRISQLTYRTNQFNFTGRKRDEVEISQILADKKFDCFKVSVTDRFGDYGLTGAVVVNKENEYIIDTFLLSCRVLGKGVEHAVTAFLGREAGSLNYDSVSFYFVKSPKNTPVENFIHSFFSDCIVDTHQGRTHLRIPSARAGCLKFEPAEGTNEPGDEKDTPETKANIRHFEERNSFLEMVIEKYLTVEGVLKEFSPESTLNQVNSGLNMGTEAIIKDVWSRVLNSDRFGHDDNFFDIGGHSILIPQIVIILKKEFNIETRIVDLFQYPTIRKLSSFIDKTCETASSIVKSTREKKVSDLCNNDIAVIGMACRYPGASTIDEFWKNLLAGKETISRFSDDEIEHSEEDFEELRHNPDYVKARGVIKDIEKFDADFFEMTPKEASLTDPQHRVWLEIAWDAFENAGLDPFGYRGSIGVFAGGFVNTYLLNNILRDPVRLENYIRMRSAESLAILTANDTAHIPAKTAYKFNLKGPAVNVQTACSTSLVAISQACRSLVAGESDVALAGGVFIMVPQESGYLHQEGEITSPDGVCRPFDFEANGTVFSNGAGAVVLKRLDDALSHSDNIYAVVKGWAVNNDGNDKISYTAPGVDGQADVIADAHVAAGISADKICYVETHGTATPLGDPIEVTALTKAFSQSTTKRQFCGIGSVKSNIGHTDAAAGAASFIKACMSVYTKCIPPSINYLKPNPNINFHDTPFYVNSALKEWSRPEPMIIGVSSFGVGGTNAHVILQEPPTGEESKTATVSEPGLLMLSAKTKSALRNRQAELLEFLDRDSSSLMKDISFTLASGRRMMRSRSYLVAGSLGEIISREAAFSEPVEISGSPKIAFMFPGQGAQYPGMCRTLYESIGFFRQIMDECFEIYNIETGKDIKPVLLGTHLSDNPDLLNNTEVTQPVLFMVEYALARLLQESGIRPDYCIGHSIGEYTAACLAGVFDLRSALRIVIRRGSLMQSMPKGRMLAVRSDSITLESLGSELFELAADNAPASCTISLKQGRESSAEQLLSKNDIAYVNLNTSHAFHSEAFDPMIRDFCKYAGTIDMHPPTIPFISCYSGRFITPGEATSPGYWANQLRHRVRFREGISLIAGSGNVVFLEVGPDTHLSTLARQNPGIPEKDMVISILGKNDQKDERSKILMALGELFIRGLNPDIKAFLQDSGPKKVPLPSYPYERKRYWIDYKIAGGEKLIKQTGEVPFNPVTERVHSVQEGLKEVNDTGEMKSVIGSGDLTASEKLVMELWCDAFMRKGIGVTDNFFDAGGDSLMAITVVSRIKKASGKNLPLKVFLKSPKIKDIARALDEM